MKVCRRPQEQLSLRGPLIRWRSVDERGAAYTTCKLYCCTCSLRHVEGLLQMGQTFYMTGPTMLASEQCSVAVQHDLEVSGPQCLNFLYPSLLTSRQSCVTSWTCSTYSQHRPTRTDTSEFLRLSDMSDSTGQHESTPGQDSPHRSLRARPLALSCLKICWG